MVLEVNQRLTLWVIFKSNALYGIKKKTCSCSRKFLNCRFQRSCGRKQTGFNFNVFYHFQLHCREKKKWKCIVLDWCVFYSLLILVWKSYHIKPLDGSKGLEVFVVVVFVSLLLSSGCSNICCPNMISLVYDYPFSAQSKKDHCKNNC